MAVSEGSDRPGSDDGDAFASPANVGTDETPAGDNGAAPGEAGRLELGDDDVRLPWLEGSDEDDDDDAASGAGELLRFALLGIAVLALIVGTIWWATRKSTDGEVVADGSTIAAPAGPYKEKPEDPEGKTFAGTGDTSFAVSEGQTRAARLGQGETPAASPAPGFATVAKQDGKTVAVAASAAGGGSAASGTTGGVGVQVGAYSSRKSAEEGWTKLSGQSDALSGVHHRIVEGTADIGTVYRLQAIAPDAAAARALCGRLRDGGIPCQVKN